MATTEALSIQYERMTKEIADLKEGQKNLVLEIKELGNNIFKKLDENYVNKMEFKPYQNKIDGIQKGLLWVVGIILATVIGAILNLVL